MAIRFLFLFGPFRKFVSHKVSLSALFGVGTEEVWEEENLQNDEDDEYFNDDNQPQRLPQRHAAETIVVQTEGTVKETVVGHSHRVFSASKDK